MNRFHNPNSNKFGMKPIAERINYANLEATVKEILPTASIWDLLGITEMEYYEKYHKTPFPEKAIQLENKSVEETKENI